MTGQQKALQPDERCRADDRQGDDTPPLVSGQCAEVLNLIRKHQPISSFVLTADHAIPEAAARIHELRHMGWNIITNLVPEVTFRGRTRKHSALYSLGSKEWSKPKLSSETCISVTCENEDDGATGLGQG